MHRAKVRCAGDTPPGLRHGRQESAQVETARGDVPDVGVDGSGERGRGAGQLWHPRVSGRPRWQASARVAARRSFEAATRTGSSPGSGRIHRLNGRAARLNGPFLGANTMYWQIRLAGLASRGPRTLVGYRTDATLDLARTSEPSQATGLWRDSSRFPPENAVTGMQYECFPVDAPYRVVSPRWWGFAGPSVKAGTAFPHLVGVEADRVYPIRSTPAPCRSCRTPPTRAAVCGPALNPPTTPHDQDPAPSMPGRCAGPVRRADTVIPTACHQAHSPVRPASHEERTSALRHGARCTQKSRS